MQDLLRATMRLRPDRILVGEVRGPEALDLLKSWNTGHPGGIATVHANGCAGGLVRLEGLIAEAGVTGGVQSLISEAVDLVIAIDRDASAPAGRRVTEMATVRGFRDGQYELVPEAEG